MAVPTRRANSSRKEVSIRLAVPRRIDRGLEHVPSTRGQETTNESHGDGKSDQGVGSRDASGNRTPQQDGKIQRTAGQSRRNAGGRRPAADLKGQACKLFRKTVSCDRRPFHGDQGVDRRVLDLAGAL